MTTKAIPEVGDIHHFSTGRGYKLHQERPFACRYSCKCENQACDGIWTRYDEPITEIIRWADNSIEVRAIAADGTKLNDTIVAPHGDACF